MDKTRALRILSFTYVPYIFPYVTIGASLPPSNLLPTRYVRGRVTQCTDDPYHTK